MKTILFYTILLLSSLQAMAGVERVSFYFEDTTLALTKSSMDQLRSFKSRYMNDHAFYIQVIEINSFSKIENDQLANELSRQRMKQVCKLLCFCEEQPALNPWGNQKREVNFIPVSWNRVDIYYYVSELYEPNEVHYRTNPVRRSAFDEKSLTQNEPSVKIHEESDQSASGYSSSFQLNIEFIPGKAKVKPNHMSELEQLLKLLQENEEVYAHIEGHVCCGNRKSLSKRRARTVHRFLVKNGIDRSRLSYEGFGNEAPLVFPERTAKDRSANRRVEVDFTTNQLMVSTNN